MTSEIGIAARRFFTSPWLGAAFAVAATLATGERAFAQFDVRKLTQPIPVLNTGGHSAPVRALVFAPPEGAQLLSAGFDKIINVWNLRDDPPGLTRTIRPRIWRGYAGAIFAMALSPRPGADGHRLLAVAGIGVENSRGEIGLYRYPGSNNIPTGDIVAQLPGGAPGGHTSTVTGLAFDPRGTFLASASNDNTARIWDIANRTTVAVLNAHTRPINALAYLPDGRRLVTAGADGLVILWDADRRVRLAEARPNPRRQRANDPAGDAINAMDVSADGRWVVIGRENGDLIRYDAANLGNSVVLHDSAGGEGAVEALAISHDSKKLVTSQVSFGLKTPGERPRVECDLVLRAMPSGAPIARLGRSSNLVQACAFSPDDHQLAYAGGDSQGITVNDLIGAGRPSYELAGQGSSLWDVGFGPDSLAIGYARTRPDLPDPPLLYEDFDLGRNRVVPFDRADLSRALPTWNGWTVRPVDPYTLDVLNARNAGHRLKLDPILDRRWWSYSFLPPGPGHARATLAIGCEAGVAIYRLDDGIRTRLFAGHNGPVYALAPSPDNRWLVTGSSDQTARIWRLADCDAIAPLGARFVPDGQGRAKVASVDRFSFAEAMGMQVNDVILSCLIGKKAQTSLAAVEGVLPNIAIEFTVRRQGQPEPIPLGTTKRDAPAVSIFPALDREWIVWSPQGDYETSAIGDRRYLGWHRNRSGATLPTDYFSFDHFEKELRHPDALLRFLQTADRAALVVVERPPPPPQVALAPGRGPEQVVAEDVLPRVAILTPERPAFAPLVVPAGDLPVRVRAASEDPVAGRGLIRTIRVQIDGGKASEVTLPAPLAEVDRVIPLVLGPGRHRLSVTALNDRNQERTESFDLVAQEPARLAPVAEIASPAPQLVVLSIGAGAFAGSDASVPHIPFAVEDIRDLAAFLAAPLGTSRYLRVDSRAIAGPEATAGRINEAFHHLDEQRSKGDLGPGDAVFVMIESHFISYDPPGAILVADSDGRPSGPSVPAKAIADCLGQLADYGCKVVLLIDSLHESRPDPRQSQRALIEWTRSLYRKNVITFVASIHGPSQRVTSRAHGAFAQGVLDVLNVRGQSRLSDRTPSEFTLFDFQDSVTRNVLALTNRQQNARCYIPDTIPSKVPIFVPPARRPAREAPAE